MRRLHVCYFIYISHVFFELFQSSSHQFFTEVRTGRIQGGLQRDAAALMFIKGSEAKLSSLTVRGSGTSF